MPQYVDPSSAGLWYQAVIILISAVALFGSRLSSKVGALFRRVRTKLRDH